MSSTVKLTAEPRTAKGSLQCAKLRREGKVPGNLYGHKQDALRFQATEDDVNRLVRSGAHIIDVTLDGKNELALLREVQYDSMGDVIQHFDLQRVDPNERLTVEIHVELRGTAPGILAGGVLEHSLRSLTVECPVSAIPDNIVIKVGELQLDGAIHVREVELPPNVKVLNNPEAIVVRVAKPQAAIEPTAAGVEAGPAQPEVIGRKAEEKEEGEEKEKK